MTSTLLTHLYEYFGVLLGCSKFGSSYIPYAGDTSMYDVHKFMGLDKAEVQYFISQVGLAAASFGVSSSDVSAVGSALMSAFGYRCEPPASIPPTASPMLQSICIDVRLVPDLFVVYGTNGFTVRLPCISQRRLRRLWPSR